MRLLISASLVGHTVRAVAWQPPLLASVVATVAVAAGPGQGTVLPLQLAAVVLGASAAFAFDDPAFELVAALPSTLAARRSLRLLLLTGTVGAVWGILLAWRHPAEPQELWTLLAMFAGLFGLSIGISGAAGRRTRGRGAAVAGPTLLLALIASSVVTPRWRPLPLGDVPGGWAALQLRWSSAAVLGAGILSVSSRDALARPHRRGRRSRGHPRGQR
jgi:hypothetical protein